METKDKEQENASLINQTLFDTLVRLYEVQPTLDEMWEIIDAADMEESVKRDEWEREKAKEKSILQEASEQLEAHDSDRGKIGRNFDEIAAVARLITGKHVSAEDCYKIMIAVKLIREKASHNRDNLVDLVAYANALHERAELPF